MYEGEYCEERSKLTINIFIIFFVVDASGSFSFLMFIFMIGLVIAGIIILWQRDKFRDEIRRFQEQQRGTGFSNSYDPKR